MDSTFPFFTSSLKNVYGTVTDGSAPGLRNRSTAKLTSNMARNHSHALRGGIRKPLPSAGGPAPLPGGPGLPLRARRGPPPVAGRPWLPDRRRERGPLLWREGHGGISSAFKLTGGDHSGT